ncbi:MAG: hypothetical protein V1887_04565 [Candidatus Aenigmatarchaeota archaeon]
MRDEWRLLGLNRRSYRTARACKKLNIMTKEGILEKEILDSVDGSVV